MDEIDKLNSGVDDDMSNYKETLEEAQKIKKALNLESIDTALLILIQQDLDTIRFHNSY